MNPRLCTLAENELHCQADIDIIWRSDRQESVCVSIVERPEIEHCWDNYREGTYSIKLTFSSDLVVELRDKEARELLVSETLAVVREMLRYRHKRRKPWNLFQ
ncbi:DUF3019 domain-containing protein [Exilibacterium tricleocarpae]|uniref:DUF3019 domain-containing protein n=1 Tax=Exilibacterium tricleocarpae TaxID=2591008 RepID=UPI0015D34B8E|nr:DUF3019 domain-containing protein [Exilibacterium tricleocarpae]